MAGMRWGEKLRSAASPMTRVSRRASSFFVAPHGHGSVWNRCISKWHKALVPGSCNPQVPGSSPGRGAKYRKARSNAGLFFAPMAETLGLLRFISRLVESMVCVQKHDIKGIAIESFACLRMLFSTKLVRQDKPY